MNRYSVQRSTEDRTKHDVLYNGAPLAGFTGLDFKAANQTAKDLTLGVLVKPEPPAPSYADLFIQLGLGYPKLMNGADDVHYYCYASGQPRHYADPEYKYALIIDMKTFPDAAAVKAWAEKQWPKMMASPISLDSAGFERIGQKTFAGSRFKDGKERTVWTVEFRAVFND